MSGAPSAGSSRLVLGVGLRPCAGAQELCAVAEGALGTSPAGEVVAVVTVDARCEHPAVLELASRYGAPVLGVPADLLAEQAVPSPSDVVRAAVGTPSVAEAAVTAVGARLLGTRRRGAAVTVAVGDLQPEPEVDYG